MSPIDRQPRANHITQHRIGAGKQKTKIKGHGYIQMYNTDNHLSFLLYLPWKEIGNHWRRRRRRRLRGVWLRKENGSRLSTWSSSQGGSQFHVIIATTRARTTTKTTVTVGTIVTYIQRRAMIRTEKPRRCIVETLWCDAWAKKKRKKTTEQAQQQQRN